MHKFSEINSIVIQRNFKSCVLKYIYCIIFFSNLMHIFNPFAPGDFAEKRVLKLVEWFSGHCRAIKS